MKKIVTPIKDIQHIEKELHSNPVGVLALNLKNDELFQTATTFLYQDKNVYFFLDVKDEFFESIRFETDGKFVLVKNDKAKKSKLDFTPVYNVFSISITGSVKKVDDDKLMISLKKNYLKKYSSRIEEREKSFKAGHAVFIDTEEIQAFEETGG